VLGRHRFEPLRQRRKRLNRLLGLCLFGGELGDMLGVSRLGGGELGLKALDIGLERLDVAFEGAHERGFAHPVILAAANRLLTAIDAAEIDIRALIG
jgi:hypothetical protein